MKMMLNFILAKCPFEINVAI